MVNLYELLIYFDYMTYRLKILYTHIIEGFSIDVTS